MANVANDPHWVQVESLTTYEVAPDGSSVKLNLLDERGEPTSLIVPFEMLRILTMSMPKIAQDALRRATGREGMRLVHGIQKWKLERAEDPQYVILTVATPDHMELSFALKDEALAEMAGLMSDFHVEAFPEGLKFH